MSFRSLGTFLLLEGAILTGLLLARATCLRVLPADTLPTVLRRRIELGNRVAPAVLALSVVALVVGAALLLAA